MTRSAGNSWHAKAGAVAMLLPFLALTACANSSDAAMSEKLAAAEAAANKAIEAQHAAEKAAATAASIRPVAPQAAVVSDSNPSESDNDDNNPSHDEADNSETMGGSGQTVSPDSIVIPGQGV